MKRKTTEDFIIDAYCKHGDKYNYSLVIYKNTLTKVMIVCLDHGVFEQRPSDHLRGQGCLKCYSGAKTTKQFIIDATRIHGDRYDYSLVEYKGSDTKIDIICPVHGTFEQQPHGHLKGHRCPKCHGNIRKTTEQFIKESKIIHGDRYDYSMVKYNNSRTKVKILCHKHGMFKQTPSGHINHKKGCIKCANDDLRSGESVDVMIYRSAVKRYTDREYKKYNHLINPDRLPRSRDGYHLDHKYSIAEGFKNNIPAYIIGNQNNLELLYSTDNIKKGIRCSITKEELFSNVFM